MSCITEHLTVVAVEPLFALQKCGGKSLDEMGNKAWSKKGGEQPASNSIKKGAALFQVSIVFVSLEV